MKCDRFPVHVKQILQEAKRMKKITLQKRKISKKILTFGQALVPASAILIDHFCFNFRQPYTFINLPSFGSGNGINASQETNWNHNLEETQ